MKYLFIYTFTITMFFLRQEKIMYGEYEMQYEENYASQTSIIKFNDNVYERRLLNGKKVKGSIKLEKHEIILEDFKTGLVVKFFKMHKNRDTIYFKTFKAGEKVVPTKDVILYSGKLIKTK